VPRSKFLPSRNRGIPIPIKPITIGGHLRKRRLELKVFQAEAARQLEVSTVTLSKWECDKLYPIWPYWPRIVKYLGHDPFDNPALGKPKSNESRDVASLLGQPKESLGHRLIARRMELMKSRAELAKQLGVSEKTLRGWEVNRRKPSKDLWDRAVKLLNF
jgi:DNA-binding XRE family transcriptional regulator